MHHSSPRETIRNKTDEALSAWNLYSRERQTIDTGKGRIESNEKNKTVMGLVTGSGRALLLRQDLKDKSQSWGDTEEACPRQREQHVPTP